MSDQVDVYNQEQIVAAIAAITAVVQANTITIEALKVHLGLSGVNTGDQDLTGLVHSNRTALDAVSGTNTGDNATNSQYSGLVSNATHTGDVTGATALTIANNAVTPAKMADVATGTVFYRKTAATGDPEVQTLATLKTDLGLSGTNTGDNATNSQYSGLVSNATHTGDVTGATALTIAAEAVTTAKMADLATGAVIVGVAGRPTGTTTPTFAGVHNHGGQRIANVGVAIAENDAVTAAEALSSGLAQIDANGKIKEVPGTVINAGSVAFTGSISSDGEFDGGAPFERDGVAGYIYVPLATPITHTSYDGDAKSTTARTSLTLASGWSAVVPADARALMVTLVVRDSAALGQQYCYAGVYPNATVNNYVGGVVAGAIGGDVLGYAAGIVNMPTSQTIYYQINASGTGTLDFWITILGYFI